MSNRVKQRVVGSSGTGIGVLWAAYSHFTTAASLPGDVSKLGEMMADPPVYLPYMLLVASVLVFAWSFWPSDQKAETPESGGQQATASGSSVVQQHSGTGHNINAGTVNLGSQYLQPSDELFAHLVGYLQKEGVTAVNLHALSDGNSMRISEAAKDYFKNAGFEIKDDMIYSFLSKPLPAPYFINAKTINSGVADVWFDGGTPLDRF